MSTAQNRRPGKAVAIPEELHPQVVDALNASRHRAAVLPPGGGAARRVGGPDDRDHRHRERQVAVLPAPDARRAVPRRQGARAVPVPRQGARAGPGPCAARVRRRPRCATAIYDGDTPREQRSAIRKRANVVLTNPDMLHLGILPNHRAWGDFFSNLALVVVDEAHVYRGVFGSHVGNVLRRLRRVAHAYGTDAAVHPGQRHDRQPGGAGRAADRAGGHHGGRPTTARRARAARSRCGTRRSPTRSSPRAGRRWPRRPTCSPSWSSRARARSCSCSRARRSS